MDEDRISHKLDQLDQYLTELRDDRPDTFDAYTAEKRKYERLLHLCIETVIDIAALLLKGAGLGAPSDEAHIIDKLVDADIFSDDLGETVKDMKGFRNVLVHRYGEIDDRKVYEHLDRLQDFDRFREQVVDHLAEHG